MAELPFHFLAACKLLAVDPNQEFNFQNSISFEIDKSFNFTTADFSAVLIARSEHGQVSTWPLAKFNGNVLVVSPNSSDVTLTSQTIEHAISVNLIGAAEYLFNDNNKLIRINFLNTESAAWTIFGSITNYYEQLIRAKLNLPLGTTNLNGKYVVCGELKNAPGKDEFYPYLHLMAHNPNYKFDKSGQRNFITLVGEDLDFQIQQVKHAQDYYSAKIQE